MHLRMYIPCNPLNDLNYWSISHNISSHSASSCIYLPSQFEHIGKENNNNYQPQAKHSDQTMAAKDGRQPLTKQDVTEAVESFMEL